MRRNLFLLPCLIYIFSNDAYSTSIVDGAKPAEITDFGCQIFSYIYMVCTFNIPTNSITPPEIHYKTHNVEHVHDGKKDSICDKQYTFNLTQEDGSYTHQHDIYNFTIKSSNGIGNIEQHFVIIQGNYVIPAITEYDITNISSNGFSLTWEVTNYFLYKCLQCFQCEVLLNSSHYNKIQTYNCKRQNRSKFGLTVVDLPYAYYSYNVSLRLKALKGLWSQWYTKETKTMATAPKVPPTVDVSSFHLNGTHVRLFWIPTQAYHRNGSNFEYVIIKSEEIGALKSETILYSSASSVTFEWQRDHNYKFKIKSRNEKGESKMSSNIDVPAMLQNYRDRSPRWIRSIYHALNRTYTLSWTPPADAGRLASYTVFRCQSANEISNDCGHIIGYKKLSNDVLEYSTIPQAHEQSLVLAVAANYPDFYTGMHWSMCMADATGDLVQLEPEIVNISSHAMTIQWNLENFCTSHIEGYFLKYCIVNDNLQCHRRKEGPCLYEYRNVTVERTAKRFELTDLQAYSIYNVQMYIFSKLKTGPVSDVQYIETLETAPSPPLNLTYSQVTSNSVVISWYTPERVNGYRLFYIIIFNNETYTIPSDNKYAISCYNNETTAQKMSYTLTNLSSFTEYKIRVKAQTVLDSSPSNFISFKTLIGYPSSPLDASAQIGDDIFINWKPPQVPSGRTEYYEINVMTWHKNVLQEQRIYRVAEATSYRMEKLSCDNVYFYYSVTICAINVAHDAEIDWQLSRKLIRNEMDHNYSNDTLEYKSENVTVFNYSCWTTTNDTHNILLKLFLYFITSAITAMLGLYLYRYVRKMSLIECKIPQGLTKNTLAPKYDEANIILEHNSEIGKLL